MANAFAANGFANIEHIKQSFLTVEQFNHVRQEIDRLCCHSRPLSDSVEIFAACMQPYLEYFYVYREGRPGFYTIFPQTIGWSFVCEFVVLRMLVNQGYGTLEELLVKFHIQPRFVLRHIVCSYWLKHSYSPRNAREIVELMEWLRANHSLLANYHFDLADVLPTCVEFVDYAFKCGVSGNNLSITLSNATLKLPIVKWILQNKPWILPAYPIPYAWFVWTCRHQQASHWWLRDLLDAYDEHMDPRQSQPPPRILCDIHRKRELLENALVRVGLPTDTATECGQYVHLGPLRVAPVKRTWLQRFRMAL